MVTSEDCRPTEGFSEAQSLFQENKHTEDNEKIQIPLGGRNGRGSALSS